MTIITTLLLAIGPLAALLGVLGFTLMWLPDPDHHSLQLAAATATIGRRLAATGLLLYLGHHGLGGTSTIVLAVGATIIATYITRTSNQFARPIGAAP